MYYPASTLSNSNGGGSSSAWSHHTSSSTGSLPRTPTIGITTLPPSPATPGNNFNGGGVQPMTPYMSTVSLPPSAPGTPRYRANGLATPPESPENASRRTRSAPVLHPILAHNPAPCIYFNVTRPSRELVVRPGYTSFKTTTLEESAFQTPVPFVTVLIPDLGAEIQVGGAPLGAMMHGHPFPHPVTVSNIINTLGLWLSQVATREECKALPPPVMATAAQYLQARTQGHPGSDSMRRFDLLCGRVFFTGLTSTNDGSNRWIVHLSSRV